MGVSVIPTKLLNESKNQLSISELSRSSVILVWSSDMTSPFATSWIHSSGGGDSKLSLDYPTA